MRVRDASNPVVDIVCSVAVVVVVGEVVVVDGQLFPTDPRHSRRSHSISEHMPPHRSE